MYLSPELTAPILAVYLKLTERAAGDARTLTRRQLDVLRLIAEGFSTQAIGRRLGVSSKTVDSHRAKIMKRLEIHEMAGLVRYAISNTLVLSGEPKKAPRNSSH